MMLQLDWDLVEKMVADGFITARPHHALPLTIYNYTPDAQYDKVWNPATLLCRGLVATQDSERRIIARPFPKFFNIDEHETLPTEPFSVFEKYDGSLFLAARYEGDVVTATRGAFGSPQAAKGLQLLLKYGVDFIQDGWTYLFEVIYPENRIVVDYGDLEDLIFLTAINNDTGEEILPPNADVPMEQAKVYPINCLEQLQAIEEENREGFIVRFRGGLRVKVKFDGYKRLHALLTGLSTKRVWQYLLEGDEEKLNTFKVNVPDEFHAWLTGTINDLQKQYDQILTKAQAVYQQETAGLADPLGADRKEAAERFNNRKADINPAILFALLTGRKLEKTIWKRLKPAGNTVFCADTDSSVNNLRDNGDT